MSTEQLSALLAFLTLCLGAVGTWLSKSYFPHRQKMQEAELAELTKAREHERLLAQKNADEIIKVRDHERELVTTKAQADAAEEGAILKQMATLQTSLMAQTDQFAEFIIHLATTRADITDKNASEETRATLEKWVTATNELRAVREALASLVKGRDGLERMPDYLLAFITRQEVFYAQVREALKIEMDKEVK